MSQVQVRQYDPLPFDRAEILRYAACRQNGSAEMTAVLENCLAEVQGTLSGRVCFCEFAIRRTEVGLDLGFLQTSSEDLKKNLQGCDRLIVFAATVGLPIDRLITRYGRVSPVKSLFFQAIGAERIESLCDSFCADMQRIYGQSGYQTRPRFSPGYGDFSLTAQRDIFRVLDCPRRIGLSLNESLLMSPSKSVTAIVGLSQKKEPCQKRACGACRQKNCEFRRM